MDKSKPRSIRCRDILCRRGLDKVFVYLCWKYILIVFANELGWRVE